MIRLKHILTLPIVKLGIAMERLSHQIGEASLPAFANSPARLEIQPPRIIQNPTRITLGDDIKLGANSVLSADSRYPGGWMRHPEGRLFNDNYFGRSASITLAGR